MIQLGGSAISSGQSPANKQFLVNSEHKIKHLTTTIILAEFLSRVSILTRDIDIANMSVRPSVRYVPVSDENGLTYRHSF